MLARMPHAIGKFASHVRPARKPGHVISQNASEFSIVSLDHGTVTLEPLIESGGSALDLFRHAEVADAHLAETVVHILHERFGRQPAQTLPRLALSIEPFERQKKVQDDHLVASFGCVRHAATAVNGRIAGRGHDPAIKLTCFSGVSVAGAEPSEHGVLHRLWIEALAWDERRPHVARRRGPR